ncbi:MAG: TIGR03085 family metal-binding protein [Pseudonocardia sp.]
MSLAVTERAALADTLDVLGPHRPTLCAGWTTRDLLAHLLVRERQPWASAGIVLEPLAWVTEKAMASWADTPWDEAVQQFREGPPLWSPYRVPAVDTMFNGAEHFVHHEDARRGEPGWQARPPDPTRDAELWAILERTARMLYRRSPVGVVLHRPAGTPIVARPGERVVTISGEPGELLLHGFGRGAVHVETEGADADVAALGSAPRGF